MLVHKEGIKKAPFIIINRLIKESLTTVNVYAFNSTNKYITNLWGQRINRKMPSIVVENYNVYLSATRKTLSRISARIVKKNIT